MSRALPTGLPSASANLTVNAWLAGELQPHNDLLQSTVAHAPSSKVSTVRLTILIMILHLSTS
jgi:hypothetical protein